MLTARPDDFDFPRRTHEPSSSLVSKSGRGPGRQRDIEKSQRSPSLSTTYPDSDKDLTAPSRNIFTDEDRREQSPQRTRRKDGSPATFTFPATPSVKVPPSSKSSPTLTPQPPEPVSGPSNHSAKASLEENHGSGPLAPSPLARSQSSAPYVPQDNSGFVRPPPPQAQPTRQLSASVLELRTRPFRSASTSTQNESASTLSVPKPSALREALNVSLSFDLMYALTESSYRWYQKVWPLICFLLHPLLFHLYIVKLERVPVIWDLVQRYQIRSPLYESTVIHYSQDHWKRMETHFESIINLHPINQVVSEDPRFVRWITAFWQHPRLSTPSYPKQLLTFRNGWKSLITD